MMSIMCTNNLTLTIPEGDARRCCPKCGSSNVDFEDSWYGDGEGYLDSDYKFYEFVCDDCECVFRVVVQEVPIGVQIKGLQYTDEE